MDTPDLEMVVNTEVRSKTEERKLDTHATCIATSCQGKVAGDIYSATCSAIEGDTTLCR